MCAPHPSSAPDDKRQKAPPSADTQEEEYIHGEHAPQHLLPAGFLALAAPGCSGCPRHPPPPDCSPGRAAARNTRRIPHSLSVRRGEEPSQPTRCQSPLATWAAAVGGGAFFAVATLRALRRHNAVARRFHRRPILIFCSSCAEAAFGAPNAALRQATAAVSTLARYCSRYACSAARISASW
eukprot:COSAG05_NODE_1228_length_5449_cov_51.123178_8_plen_182_part_00